MRAKGVKFGADGLGKAKTGVQCVVIAAILLAFWYWSEQPVQWPVPRHSEPARAIDITRAIEIALKVLVYAMVLVTVASGAQYIIKAIRLWRA